MTLMYMSKPRMAGEQVMPFPTGLDLLMQLMNSVVISTSHMAAFTGLK